MLIKINVTKEVLEASKFCVVGESIAKSCAIACAIRQVFPMAKVEREYISPFGYSDEAFINLPVKASDFISEFDPSTPEQRATMKPISFEIEVPDSVIDRIGIEQVNEILSKSETLTRVI